MVPSAGSMRAQHPLTVPSRSPVRSLTSTHSHRNTCPVEATSSRRVASPETWTDKRPVFPAKKKTHTHKQR